MVCRLRQLEVFWVLSVDHNSWTITTVCENCVFDGDSLSSLLRPKAKSVKMIMSPGSVVTMSRLPLTSLMNKCLRPWSPIVARPLKWPMTALASLCSFFAKTRLLISSIRNTLQIGFPDYLIAISISVLTVAKQYENTCSLCLPNHWNFLNFEILWTQ